MEENRFGIIYAPRSGASYRRWERIRDCLEKHNAKYDVMQSDGYGDIGRLTDMLIKNGYTTIVVVGGDTALGEALNSLMNMPDSVIDKVRIGTIPNGIGNNFAAFWGLDMDYENAIGHLMRGRTRKVDVGVCRFRKDGTDCVRYFLNAVNIGIGASILAVMSEVRRFIGVRLLVHLLILLRIIFEKNRYKIRAIINYEPVDENMAGLCVGSSLGYGQTPNAVPYNGMLDVSVVKGFDSIRQIFHTLWLLISGKFLNDRSVVRPYRTRTVQIEELDGARVAVDSKIVGDIEGKLEIDVIQERIRFIIPSRQLS